jgi:hypothetical protein
MKGSNWEEGGRDIDNQGMGGLTGALNGRSLREIGGRKVGVKRGKHRQRGHRSERGEMIHHFLEGVIKSKEKVEIGLILCIPYLTV